MEDRVILQKRKDTFKKQLKILSSKYEGLKTSLNENETYTQVKRNHRFFLFSSFCNYVLLLCEIHVMFNKRSIF